MANSLRDNAIVDSTAAKYKSHWRQWCKFSSMIQWSRWLAADIDEANTRLGLFAVYCWRYGWNREGMGNQHGTILLKLSSIRWFHRRYRNLVLPESPGLQLLMQDIRRLSNPVAKKHPVSPEFLRLLYRNHVNGPARGRLLWGSVVLAYFFLLRRSEYLVNGAQRNWYCLKTTDVQFSDDHGKPTSYSRAVAVSIRLAGAKNDQHGRGSTRTMYATGDPLLCPREALKTVLRARKAIGRQHDIYLCANLDVSEVSRALKTVAVKTGVPASNYSSHSIRIGGATSLLRGHVDGLVIKRLGRWLSSCYEGYPVLDSEATRGLSARMI
jgi:hypothetical protein